MVGNVVQLPMNETISVPSLYWVEARWSNRTAMTTFGLAVTGVASNGTASFRAAENGLVYLGAAPSTPRVDGAFGDWQGRPYGQDLLGDVTNRTGSQAYDANVDLLATAVDLGTTLTGYVQVDGRMLGGQDIPTSRVRTYPAPPSSNNTTIPSVVPPQEGVDVMYAYIDADNSSATGLRADVGGRAYGFDDAIAAVGRNGVVNSSGLYGFALGQPNPWNLLRSVELGLDAHRMESAVERSADRRDSAATPSRHDDDRPDHLPRIRQQRADVGSVQGSRDRRAHGHEQRRRRLLHVDPPVPWSRQ